MRGDNCADSPLASVRRVIQLHERGDNCVGVAYIRPVPTATSQFPFTEGHSEHFNLKLTK